MAQKTQFCGHSKAIIAFQENPAQYIVLCICLAFGLCFVFGVGYLVKFEKKLRNTP